MRLPLYQFDAFATDQPFSGNPAAVVPLEHWLDDATLQSIAMENNLSETAFYVPEGEGFGLRWFTPTVEVDLCGHATLATSHLVFKREPARQEVVFHSPRSGRLVVRRDGERLALDFPAWPASPGGGTIEAVGAALGGAPREVLVTQDLVAVFEDEVAIRALAPDFARVKPLHPQGVIATAPGRDADYVLRFFAPSLGIDEDPATGRAQCSMAPLWSGRLGRTTLRGRQLSARGAEFHCALSGERVIIAGRIREYLEGTIEV